MEFIPLALVFVIPALLSWLVFRFIPALIQETVKEIRHGKGKA